MPQEGGHVAAVHHQLAGEPLADLDDPGEHLRRSEITHQAPVGALWGFAWYIGLEIGGQIASLDFIQVKNKTICAR